MSKSFMSIGEYARMVGVSPEYLKFYDKKGLVKPVWKDDRSYRYYADYQITHFIELQQLNNMGVQLEDAKDIITNSSLSQRLDIYKNALQEKREEIVSLLYLMNQIEDTTNALDKINRKSGWRIEELPLCYFAFVDFAKRKEGRNSAIWKDYFSMNVTQYVKLQNPSDYELIPGKYQRLWGAIQPELTEQILNDELNTIIPVGGCKCFIYEYSIPTDYDDEGKLSDKVWDLSDALSIMKDNNIIHNGEFFQKRLCTSHEADGEYLHVQTIVPIR
ncbi:MAG: MerR family transcriptional regulator [Pseudobutyrivibrio sp.]|nr:MerR family transcriptional regulator [Pseudobutyrivibrio sp.]